MNTFLQKISLIALFIALGVTLGFALFHIPNVELITATIFIAGYIMGIKEGLFIGIFIESIYSFFNPLGIAAPPIFLGQILAMGFTGVLGGLMRNRTHFQSSVFYIELGVAGFLSTMIFAILTTLFYTLSTGLSKDKLLISFITGLGFYITHIITNTLIFIILIPVLIKTINNTFFLNTKKSI
jgi:energy-coupling factor transport system substrate-specific component